MPNSSSALVCPLCFTSTVRPFHQDERRPYLRCQCCRLIFVPPDHFLSASAEKAEYDLHQNSPVDPAYRRFLSRLFEPMQARLAPHSRGLDFGAGPGPTLSLMFEEAGHAVAIYDPFYAPDPGVFGDTYHFITASEVVEHLHRPAAELERLWGCLKPGGTLGLMTKLVLDRAAFAGWHYKNDPTHVCFFSRATFQWLAARWQAGLTFRGQDVILLKRRQPR